MTQEQLFASFVLDQSQGLEIALPAEYVTEATPINGTIQRLPGSIDFLEGIMHLRDEVIPVINLKKRLGLLESSYPADAKIAVVSLFNHRYGLLFDDIKEVFRADQGRILPISKALQTKEMIISALINRDPGRRVVELLDLNNLLNESADELSRVADELHQSEAPARVTTWLRYVIFLCNGQEYGVPVEYAREITFYQEINQMFKTGIVEGSLEIRGKTIPVVNAHALLCHDFEGDYQCREKTRVLVLASEECSFGVIVDEIKEILPIPEENILPFPSGRDSNVRGMFSRTENHNVILLNMYSLVCEQLESIKSMARIGSDTSAEGKLSRADQISSHHLITENCYLLFSIGKNFAIEIKDVQEIIENTHMMGVPGASGYGTGVINLRGQVVPVVNLRSFYHYPVHAQSESNKLIICAGHGQTVALEVDQIVTIYKQEQYHATPSLTAQLKDKADTVDRLIEYLNGEGVKEHVLVVNTHNLIRNHLHLSGKIQPLNQSALAIINSEPADINQKG
jgi:purine-binding chemotaxis protein CheW